MSDLNLDDEPDELSDIFISISKSIPYKIVIFVFVFYILMNTSTFTEDILGKLSGTVEQRYPTDKGIMIQALLLSVGVIVINILDKTKLI